MEFVSLAGALGQSGHFTLVTEILSAALEHCMTMIFGGTCKLPGNHRREMAGEPHPALLSGLLALSMQRR
jgi:hypothetical protein